MKIYPIVLLLHSLIGLSGSTADGTWRWTCYLIEKENDNNKIKKTHGSPALQPNGESSHHEGEMTHTGVAISRHLKWLRGCAYSSNSNLSFFYGLNVFSGTLQQSALHHSKEIEDSKCSPNVNINNNEPIWREESEKSEGGILLSVSNKIRANHQVRYAINWIQTLRDMTFCCCVAVEACYPNDHHLAPPLLQPLHVYKRVKKILRIQK